MEKKKILHNKFNKEYLKEELKAEKFSRTTVSFYKYINIDKPLYLREKLYEVWDKLKIKGRIYLANEGINAQLSCPTPNLEYFKKSVRNTHGLNDVTFKFAIEEKNTSFLKLIIKVKKKIVADGIDHNEYDVTNVGTHLNAEEWNLHMENGAIVVDVRNHYESRVGHFIDALCPDVDTFREELPIIKNTLLKNKKDKILLYCTGGIRCEKTSAYLKHHGFKDVNQLHGGIIDYVKQIKEQNLENKFVGKNFVFDDRLGEKVSDDIISHCDQCSEACDDYTNCKYVDCNLLFLQCMPCGIKYDGCCTNKCQEMAKLSQEKQKKIRQNKNNTSIKSFQKGIRPKENTTDRK